MKICILGLDCAAPEVIFGDERLVNIRRLMDTGVYGRLESVNPPITVPAWMCMSTSQDPGSLGVYGFRNRSDHSYDKLAFANSTSIKALAMWDQLARQGKKSIIVGVPPNYPPRRVNGISIGCFLTPDTVQFEPGNPYQNAIPEYYLKLDEQIGRVLELLNNDTIVLVVSDHGAQRLDGGVAINEWLVREGLLVLNEYPTTLTPFEKLNVNWSKTKVWSEGGYYARVFFNIQGREPQGLIPQAEYESFQDEMRARIEALPDDKG